jgi:hypothetical protein
MGVLHYLPRALVAYAARATQATTPQEEAAERIWQERYAHWRQQELTRLREALLLQERTALEDGIRARLVAEVTPAFALGLAVRVAVDEGPGGPSRCAGLRRLVGGSGPLAGGDPVGPCT